MGMKEDPIEISHFNLQIPRKVTFSVSPVEGVTDNGVSFLCQVYSDLVRSAGFYSHPQECQALVFPYNPVMRYC